MSNAVVSIHPNAYDTRGASLLGRHAAGESFLRGFIRHGDVERFHFWNVLGQPQDEMDALLARIETPRQPVSWLGQRDRGGFEAVGVLNMPTPNIGKEAWQRHLFGSRRYALCGITHTTATAKVMTMLPDMMIAPLDEYDALICTSSAVRAAVEAQLQMMREYMAGQYGPRRRPEPIRTTIPLGVNASDFAATPEQRRHWRERLDIPDDAVVALYVGRHEIRTKMNPALMAMALERAARRTDRQIYWVNSGWVEPASTEEIYHAETRKLCPSVHYRTVDGRLPDVRFSIWSVADLFISFSDNIQETFGLTPIEAMAAGLPCVVSDWNGYKDTVRDGLDGYRIPTLSARPGFGADLAYWFGNEWINYPTYVAATAQNTAVDLACAEAAILTLVEDEPKRRAMGAQAQARAREVFDWSAVIPQYQALWSEQDARRRAAPPDPVGRTVPYHPDPYTLFGGYPTRHIGQEDLVSLAPGLDWAAAKARLAAPLAAYSRFNRPTEAEVSQVVAFLLEHGPAPVRQVLETAEPARRAFLERGLIWMARHDVLAIQPPGQRQP